MAGEVQKNKSLEDRIKEVEKKLGTFAEAALVTYLQRTESQIVKEYDFQIVKEFNLWRYIKDEIIRLGLNQQEDFIKLAMGRRYSSYKPGEVADILSLRGLMHLRDSGYITCMNFEDLALRLSGRPRFLDLIKKIKNMVYGKLDHICISNESDETFKARYGMSAAEYLKKLEEEIIQKDPFYRFIKDLEQRIK